MAVTLLVLDRLELVANTEAMARAQLEEPHALADLLGARVPASWPPELFDRGAMEYSLRRIRELAGQEAWWNWYFVQRAEIEGGRVLVGVGGYKGPPEADGTIEFGYSVLPEYQRRGYATEAARGLIAHAFAQPGVARVIAETLPELAGSIAVMEHCGMRFAGDGSEPGVIRYVLERADHAP
jgi:RimJ/RimL family protein N-acetyltransferase